MKILNTQKKRLLLRILLLGGLLLIYSWQIENAKVVEKSNKKIHMQIDNHNGGISVSEADLYHKDNLQSDDKIKFVLWKEKDGIVENDIIGRSAETNVISANGTMQILFDEPIPYIDIEDNNVCLLGYKTAIELFGSKEINNVEVQKEGKTYKVIGVLHSIENVFICMTNEKDDILNRVTVMQSFNVSPMASMSFR